MMIPEQRPSPHRPRPSFWSEALAFSVVFTVGLAVGGFFATYGTVLSALIGSGAVTGFCAFKAYSRRKNTDE